MYSILRPSAFASDPKAISKNFPKSVNRIEDIIRDLVENPSQGNRYPGFGSNEVRKIRIGLPEYKISQSNGLRLIFGVKPEKKIVALLTIYFKNIVSVNNEMTGQADAYQKHNILTPKYYDDGLHIAIATVTEADMLVSRNFRHIVRAEKIRLFNAVNLENGYKPIQIYSSREVTIYGAD